jgi:CYTH domain-containing protein
MAKEIERKYLAIKSKLPKLENGEVYSQGYLCLSPLIRFRIVGNDTCLNIKNLKTGNVSRDEFEFHNNLNEDEINDLAKLAINKPIQKTRYKIEYESMVWEIDVYSGDNEGLITVDIEMPNESFELDFPDWVDKSREITNDERFFNRNLGDHPYKEFREEVGSSS